MNSPAPWIATTADGKPREHLEPRESRNDAYWAKEADWNRVRVTAEAAGLTAHQVIELIGDHEDLVANASHVWAAGLVAPQMMPDAQTFADSRAAETETHRVSASFQRVLDSIEEYPVSHPRLTITESGPIPVPSLRDRIGNYLCARPTLCMAIAYIVVVCALLFFAYTLGWAALVTGAVRK